MQPFFCFVLLCCPALNCTTAACCRRLKVKGKETEWSLADWCTLCVLFSGEGAAVLLRSLEPLQGQTTMRQLRATRRREGSRELKEKELCNGPSKLCQALDILRCFDRRDLSSDPEVWLESIANTHPIEAQHIVTAPRIGVESHGEWAKKPLRFYLRGHPCVSVVNKESERESLEIKWSIYVPWPLKVLCHMFRGELWSWFRKQKTLLHS